MNTNTLPAHSVGDILAALVRQLDLKVPASAVKTVVRSVYGTLYDVVTRVAGADAMATADAALRAADDLYAGTYVTLGGTRYYVSAPEGLVVGRRIEAGD